MLTHLPSSFEFPSMHMVLDDSRIRVPISLCLANNQHLRRLIKFSEVNSLPKKVKEMESSFGPTSYD
jgi:hypothetical protein